MLPDHYLQDAAGEPGGHLVAVDVVSQRDGAGEPAVRQLPVAVGGALRQVVGTGALDGQHVVLHRDLEVGKLESGDLEAGRDLGAGLDDVDSGHQGRRSQPIAGAQEMGPGEGEALEQRVDVRDELEGSGAY